MFELKRRGITAACLLALAGVGGMSAAHAETMTMKVALTAAAEVPPNDSKGKGDATFTYDTATKKLQWTVSYSGLTGPATAGHIHSPAAPGANAGIAIPFPKTASPIKGTATLTDAQAADLAAGKMYVNIHTKAHPSGEIRGQLVK